MNKNLFWKPFANLFCGNIFQSFLKLLSDSDLDSLSVDDSIELFNAMKMELHNRGPFAGEPVDCVLWVKSRDVAANDYNPNSVAPPEMKLLEHSISEDGYTQPIVVWWNDEKKCYEVVDGFHRNRVGKESASIQKRIHGHLPVSVANQDRSDRGDRIAATIRHNRARGKHSIDGMTEIIVELKRRFWSDEKIGTELGMDADEVLRLSQISGLADMFADRQFSEAWEAVELEGTQTDEANLSSL